MTRSMLVLRIEPPRQECVEHRVATGCVTLSGVRPPYRRARGHVIVIPDGTVTAGGHGHCDLWLADGGLWLADLGSDNGTWLLEGDGERFAPHDRPLRVRAGDTFRVGATRVTVVSVEP